MARERYLVNAGEDTIHDPEAEKRAEESVKTRKGKWDNFWFYHKWHVVIGVAAAAVVIATVVSSLKTVRPDYTVGLLTRVAYPQEVADRLGQEMAKYGVDRNGDGKVVVDVQQYQIMPPPSSSGGTASSAGLGSAPQLDPQMAEAYEVKFTGDLQSGTSMIFLADNDSFDGQEKSGNHIFAYTDGSTPPDSATDYDRMRVPLAKCPKLAGLRVTCRTSNGSADVKLLDLMKDAGISMRVYKGSAIEGKQDDYYKASLALFRKLTT